MADNNSRNSDYYDDYGDNYGSSPRRKSRYYDSDEEYPVTAKYAPYFNNYGDGTEDVSESEEIYSHSRRSSDNRRSSHTSKKKKSGKHSLRRGFCIFLALLFLVAGGACLGLHLILDPINYVDVDTSDDYLSDAEGTAGDLLNDNQVLNVMLFGVDEDSSEFGRSDTMLLLSIDNRHKKLKMTSFQRDTFVYVPDPEGAYHTKLTNAFSYGGVPLAINTIEANFGVQIDRYATVNFESFKTIVDILGGVQVELTDREILYINCQIAQNNQTEYLDAAAGPVTLNGQQALWYARNRGGDVINGVEFYEGTDWDRTERQRKFLSAVIDQMKDASITEVLSIVNEVGPYITTNLKKTELMYLVANSLTYLSYPVEQCSMPTDGNWGYEDNFAGNVIYVYDFETVRNDLAQFIYEDTAVQ
ncbi:MAG: LCP family protein [Ruminococcus sp.]|nr:LCP family protein [Ruminococcus sp.]